MKTNYRTRLWVIEVRSKDRPAGEWAATGLSWYRRRKDCQEAIDEITWQKERMEYRISKYARAA